jgi:hypothetical protein
MANPNLELLISVARLLRPLLLLKFGQHTMWTLSLKSPHMPNTPRSRSGYGN